MQVADIIDFWFSERMRKHWFNSTPEIDAELKTKFASLWQRAAAGELDTWMTSADGCLALCIVLDQLPLNMFRAQPKSFSTETQAVEVTLFAIEQGFDKQIAKDQLSFLFMPLMHSENSEHQDLSVKKFTEFDLTGNIRFAEHHRGIVKQFGRFPHRNAILGRDSSAKEVDYLNSKHAFNG